MENEILKRNWPGENITFYTPGGITLRAAPENPVGWVILANGVIEKWHRMEE